MNIEQLTGQSDAHLVEVFPGHFLHEQTVEPYRALASRAEAANIDLRMASGFRSFNRQLMIWNNKAEGVRTVFDETGKPMAMDELSDIDKVRAILRWSALPGASRHHWGTDIDVWDAGAVDKGYQLQLVSEEYAVGGVFFRLTQWLDETIATAATQFYRPYGIDLDGVAPELWHLSYRPVAERFEQQMNQMVLRETLEQSDILLKETILDNLDEIYHRFVQLRH